MHHLITKVLTKLNGLIEICSLFKNLCNLNS